MMEGKPVPLTLEERIAELEDKIRGYETKLETADSDDKRMYADLIKSTRKTLDKLILQQTQQQKEKRQLLAQQKREERQLLAQQKQSSRGNLS
jgi:prephenate dehydrogenase